MGLNIAALEQVSIRTEISTLKIKLTLGTKSCLSFCLHVGERLTESHNQHQQFSQDSRLLFHQPKTIYIGGKKKIIQVKNYVP